MDAEGRDIDDLTGADLEALVRSVMGSGRSSVTQVGQEKKKLRPRRSGASLARLERLDGVGLNQTLTIEIELPGYFVAAMNSIGGHGSNANIAYREAVQSYLLSKGQTWWQPRFMAAIRAKEIEAWARLNRARDQFTED